MSSTFCVLPFMHIETRADGFIAPCCISRDFVRDQQGHPYTLYQDSLKEVYDSPWMHQLRADLLNGVQNANCEQCWSEECAGATSKRMRENRRWQHLITADQKVLQPRFLDLKLGNLCNLKCRICSPGSSSKWAQEMSEIYGKIPNFKTDRWPKEFSALHAWPEQNKDFWTLIEEWLPAVEHFEVYGGEPFLVQRHFDILRMSIKRGYSKDQTLHYNSNGVIFPAKAFEEIFPSFKNIDIMLSIDGIEDQFEYQRHPAKWSVITKNLPMFREALGDQLQICLSVSSINVYNIPEYLQFFESEKLKVYLNIVYNPSYFDMRNLPLAVREQAYQKLQAYKFNCVEPQNYQLILEYLKGPEIPTQLPLMKETLERHDRFRKEDFRTTFPEWSQILGQSGQ